MPDIQPQSRSRSRFSLLSLLPSRHPPLVISHPLPPLPTQHTNARRPVVVRTRADSRILSSYPSPGEGDGDEEFDLELGSYYYPSDTKVLESNDNSKGEKKEDASRPRPKRVPAVDTFRVPLRSPNSTPRAKRRPPPLDLARTKATFPSVKGISLEKDEGVLPLRNQSLPVVRGGHDMADAKARAGEMLKLNPEPAKKVAKNDIKGKTKDKELKKDLTLPVPLEDPFDFVSLEAEHRYPSWKGGKVDIKPGQIIPPDLVNPLNKNSVEPSNVTSKPRKSSKDRLAVDTPIQYESVLHNVLLTPTYLGIDSTSALTTPTGESRRRTLLHRASNWGKGILKNAHMGGNNAGQVDRAVRGMKEKEGQEMERFRRAVQPVLLPSAQPPRVGFAQRPEPDGCGCARRSSDSASGSNTTSTTPSPAIRGVDPDARKSTYRPHWLGKELGEKLNEVVGWEGRRSVSASEAWREKRRKEEEVKRKRRFIRYGLAIFIALLIALAVGLSVSLLSRKSNKATQTKSSATNDTTSTASSASASPSSSALTPTSSTQAGQTLQKCLDLYLTTAQSSPTAYPCGQCVSLLAAASNDFDSASVSDSVTGTGAGTTGVGGALQFCALMDIWTTMGWGNGQGVQSWGKQGNVCAWEGVGCDAGGRVNSLVLQYPNVPATIPASLSNIVSLTIFKLLGNSSAPTGAFPTAFLSLKNLSTIDMEYTALTGPIASVGFGAAKSLQSLVLVNNLQLGGQLPSFSNNSKLATLVVTGQGLKDATTGDFPPSLTYLDLSYNAFTGAVPSFSQLTGLKTLYLTNNPFTSPPASLPSSLTTLSLTSNPNLSGSMPASVCANTGLMSCDLRSTGLTSTSTIPSSFTSTSTSTSTSASSSLSVSASASSLASRAAGQGCGVCKFS